MDRVVAFKAFGIDSGMAAVGLLIVTTNPWAPCKIFPMDECTIASVLRNKLIATNDLKLPKCLSQTGRKIVCIL